MFYRNKRYNLLNYCISFSTSVLVESFVAFFFEYPNNTNEDDINPADKPAKAIEFGSFQKASKTDTINPIQPVHSDINPANLDPDVLPFELLIASANENFWIFVLFNIIQF